MPSTYDDVLYLGLQELCIWKPIVLRVGPLERVETRRNMIYDNFVPVVFFTMILEFLDIINEEFEHAKWVLRIFDW